MFDMNKVIVIGALNTDIVATGLQRFPEAGEHVYAKDLVIGPGGKPRNIAQMIGNFLPLNSVVMLGKTTKDPYGLWKPPVEALNEVGVNTEHIIYEDFATSQKMPGIALIPVEESGLSQIIVAPGISDDLSADDLVVSQEVVSNADYLVLTMECPNDVIEKAIEIANKYDVKIMFDPGGVQEGEDISKILSSNIFLLKPNEHEAEILTGIEVSDEETASMAAKKLKDTYNIPNIVITVGEKGAYLFEKGSDETVHIEPPEVTSKENLDATGCGDQTMAVLVAKIAEGKSLKVAVEQAIVAGTLQYQRVGINPVSSKELAANLKK